MDSRLQTRYIVTKLSKLSDEQFTALMECISANDIPTVDCVVVEHDWPEYSHVVDAIMERVNGKT